mgnify:CR=1 FL=1
MNTKALHANKKFEPISGDIMPPLHLSTTYKNDVPGESEYFYGRVNNPTRELFERTLASLEGIDNYEEMHALAMASGMSAVSLIAELVKPGENVVITKDVYGLRQLLNFSLLMVEIVLLFALQFYNCLIYLVDQHRYQLLKNYCITKSHLT